MPEGLRRHRTHVVYLALAAMAGLPSVSHAIDSSPPAILQWFESSYTTIERRMADVFHAGYGAVWTPPPGRADSGNFSVGYDVYDRFDLGAPKNPTLYGTETGIRQMANTIHRAGLDFHVDLVWNHNGFTDRDTPAFVNSGGYPGFFLDFFADDDGDFHDEGDGGDIRGRLSGLIDIAHEKNHRAIRNPVPGFNNNIAAGTVPWNGRLANVPSEANRRFYPKIGFDPKTLRDPATTGNNNTFTVHSFNPDDPLGGTPVEENATGYLMRNAQWLIQVIGVDGFRLDAEKHMDYFVLDYLDRAVYRANPRKLLDGSTKHVFSYGEVFDGDAGKLLSYIRKDINPADAQKVGGNRDVFDFKLHFALKGNLEQTGTANAWQNIRGASIDFADDGSHNGSSGVKFVHNHDVHKPFALDSVAHAYVLMMPGNAAVYFNGKEFGDGRDFPKDGRSDALSVGNSSVVTRLLEARNTHGRGNYLERWIDNQGTFVFERVSSAVVGLSNRGDQGFDERTVEVGFAAGTHLIEISGQATSGTVDPFDDIPAVTTVFSEGGKNKVRIRIPRNVAADGDFHGRGFVVYGLPTPEAPAGLELLEQSRFGPYAPITTVLPGDRSPSNNFENGTQRQSDVTVITSNNLHVRLQTVQVNLLGNPNLRDKWADGDNAILALDGGRDVNGNGRVDHVAPGSVSYGFEQFAVSQPLIGPGGVDGPRGSGLFRQQIDVSKLEEGYHFLEARAFRHRTDGGPAVYSTWKQSIYVDLLPPDSAVDSLKPINNNPDNQDVWVRSVDKTADSVHVFLNLPASLTDAQVKAMVSGGNKAGPIDRDLFAFGVFNLGDGNHVITTVTYEPTGNVSVQRFPGRRVATSRGRGFGDLNFDNAYAPADVQAFDAVLYSNNTQFNPAADLDGDGLVGEADLLQLGWALHTGGANGETFDRYVDLLINNPVDRPRTYAGPFKVSGTVGKFTEGPLTISGPQTHAPGASLTLHAGLTRFASDAAGLSLTVNPGAEVNFASPQHLNALTVTGGGAEIEHGGRNTLIVKQLSLSADATLDAADNDLILDYTGAPPIAMMNQWILDGRLYAVTGQPDFPTTLAPVDNMRIRTLTWNGLAISDGVDFSQLILMFTYDADVNLDGMVTVDDYANLVANLGNPGGWSEGDLTRDGLVTEADYDLLALRLTHPLAATSRLSGLAGHTSGIPEPGLGVLLLPLALLARRRR